LYLFPLNDICNFFRQSIDPFNADHRSEKEDAWERTLSIHLHPDRRVGCHWQIDLPDKHVHVNNMLSVSISWSKQAPAYEHARHIESIKRLNSIVLMSCDEQNRQRRRYKCMLSKVWTSKMGLTRWQEQ
jgi:hypothetical protein